jgi:hypothetical protein
VPTWNTATKHAALNSASAAIHLPTWLGLKLLSSRQVCRHSFFGGATVRPLGAALAFHDVLTPGDGYWLDHPETAPAWAATN